MSKESIRKQVSLNINLDISSLEASIKREEQNLKAIKRMSIPQELMIKKTNNMLECIQKWTTELENLKKKNEDILAGELDKEIINDNPEKNKKKAKNRIIADAILKLTNGVSFMVAKFKSIAKISPHMNPIPFSAIALPRYFLTT